MCLVFEFPDATARERGKHEPVRRATPTVVPKIDNWFGTPLYIVDDFLGWEANRRPSINVGSRFIWVKPRANSLLG